MLPKRSIDEKVYWKRWKEGRDPEAGNYLVKKYMTLVDYVAGRLLATLPDNVSKDDLISMGAEGLLDALDKYDPERGYKFETYATVRIRGAIIDGLRKNDTLPRSLREKARKIDEAFTQLEQQKLRSISDEEVSAYLGISVDELRKTMYEVSLSTMVSIHETLLDEEYQAMNPSAVLENPHADHPERYLAEQEEKEMLAKAIEGLPEKEQWVVSMVYFEELSLTEIGRVLNLSTSRISQLHSKALLRLKDALEKVGHE